VILALLLVWMPALEAQAAAKTYTFGNGCQIQGQNGSGINKPWARSNN
jgi:hypothetical protein